MDNFNRHNNNVDDTNINEHTKNPEGIDSNVGDSRITMPQNKRDEEAASEISGFDNSMTDVENRENRVGSMPGWIGLALSILSFFMMPVILGGAAIIVGFIARGRGANWLGNSAIALGVISIIVRLFFMPFT
jgi:hypothetical protein